MPGRFATRKVVRRYLELKRDFDISDSSHLGGLLDILEKKGYDSEIGEQRKIMHLEIIKDEYYGLHPDKKTYRISR